MIVATSGDYGKPRPAVVIQANAFNGLASVTVLPISSHIIPAPLYRITVHPNQSNQLRKVSQIMVDKAVTIPRHKIGQRVGRVTYTTLCEIDEALRGFFDL